MDCCGIGPALATLLMLLTVFGSISMDLYLTVLPALTDELGAATSVAQFTLTACLVGLAVGRVIAGPLSDRLGRSPLLIGITGVVNVLIGHGAPTGDFDVERKGAARRDLTNRETGHLLPFCRRNYCSRCPVST